MFKRRWAILAMLVAMATAHGTVPARARKAAVAGPQFTADNQLLKPANYREWIYLSSGLGMTYGPTAAPDANPRFDNVFVAPAAYDVFRRTGTWPNGTMFVLEVRSSASEGSINKGGRFQTAAVGLEAEVKDESRFPGAWAFFDFSDGVKAARMIPRTASCYSCHHENGAVDNTFVQFYPTLLPIALEKGTVTPAFRASMPHTAASDPKPY